MSMFLSKFLSGRNITKSKLELLTDAWTGIQKYYETATDPLKDAVDLTPIPYCLENIVKLIQAEELEYERASDSLETGPCLEYLLQKRVLEELVEFAKVDTPFGMRIHCLRFFCNLVTNVHAQLLPERAVHVPLQKLITSCHRLIAHHYEQLVNDDDVCPDERYAAISDLSLELVKLMHGIFSHFKGTNAALMDLFFERGWCRGLGEKVWVSSKDGKRSHRRRESADEKIAWNLFLTPRFDMFTFLIDYMNIPGETGEIAREAVLFALRLLDGDPEYVCYVVEYSGLCEIIAERLALSFARLPKNAGAFTVTSNNRVMPVRPPRRRIHFSVPAMITNNSLLITVNAHHSFKKRRRKRSPFDNYFARMSPSTGEGAHVDEFYSFWEYLNDVARVADRRLMTALMAQLTTIFWHPVVCTALCSPSAELATASTAYTTEMVRSLTDQKLLHAFLVVLIGEEGGVGRDLEPEIRASQTHHDLIDDDHDDDSLPTDEEEEGGGKDQASRHSDVDEEMTLRLLLINRIDADHPDLSLSTLRMFDTIIETYNQFAVYNLVLRNYLDITPEGDYIDDRDKRDDSKDANDMSSVSSKPVDDRASIADSNATKVDDKNEDASEKDTQLAKKETKTEKVRWIVERILSLLPLEDELERMKSPPLSSVIPSDSFTSTVHGPGSRSSHDKDSKSKPVPGPFQSVVIPSNSYDDYFHEARERFQYGLLARNFWRFPYPPPKTRRDFAREAEDRRDRPQRRPMSMIVSSKDAAMHRDQGFDDRSSINSFQDKHATNKHVGNYEGLFLSRIFDLLFKLLESSMEQNLLVTSILQKIAGIVDKRVDGVICDWRTIRVGGDGALYGGVWTTPNANGNRRTLYSLLEQVTFEALKRAQLVPNFETRISLAKKRGVLAGPPVSHHQSHGHSGPTLLRSASTMTRSSTSREPTKSLSRHPSLTQLVFSKGNQSSSQHSPVSPSPTGVLPLRNSRENTGGPRELILTQSLSAQTNGSDPHSANHPSNAGSSTSSFFQQSQRANTTPITMTNPFAKFSNFVNSYIVLQEFCKELAAVILVRNATDYNDSGLMKYQDHNKRESMIGVPQDFWLDGNGPGLGDDQIVEGEKPSMDKWKNRYSMVSTIGDWRSVRSLDMIDETRRMRSISNDAKW